MAVIVKGKNARRGYTVRWTADGKQRERSFVTQREARDWKAKVEHDTRAGIFTDPKLGAVKFTDYAAKWIEDHQSAQTRRYYGQALRLIFEPEWEGKTLRAVASDREAAQALLRTLTPARQLLVSTVLSGALGEAVTAGRIPSHRLHGLETDPPEQRAVLIDASKAQLETLAKALPGNLNLTIWAMRGCGLRIGEAVALEPGDFRNGVLRATRQIREDGTTGPLKHRRTGDYRDIPIPGYVDEAFKGFKGFPDVSRSAYRRGFAKGREAAGLPDKFTPHTLRHIFVSICLAQYVPITDVARWVGHRSISQTYAVYGHLVPSAESRARQALDDEYEAWK